MAFRQPTYGTTATTQKKKKPVSSYATALQQPAPKPIAPGGTTKTAASMGDSPMTAQGYTQTETAAKAQTAAPAAPYAMTAASPKKLPGGGQIKVAAEMGDSPMVAPGYAQAEAAAKAQAPSAQAPAFQYGEALTASDPTQTGYLNFDRFAAANEGVSRREAKRVDDMVRAQAEKAKAAARAANDAYMKMLGQSGTGIGYDAQGNWMGGATGPQVPAYQAAANPQGILSPDGADFGEEGASTPGQGDIDAANDAYRQMLQGGIADAAGRKGALGKYTDMEEYKRALDEAAQADDMLAALQTPEGLAELLGGTEQDAALLGQAGRPGLKKTGDDFGKKGLGTEGLKDYLGGFVDKGEQYAKEAEGALNAESAAYTEALQGFDKKLADEAAAKAAEAEAAKNAPKSYDDMVASAEKEGRTMDRDTAGRRATTRNAGKLANWKGNELGSAGHDAWLLAEQALTGAGLSGGEASKYWGDFLQSLPEGVRNYVAGMIAEGSEIADELAKPNTEEDWVWFQNLFNSYMKKNPPKKGAS